jgi:hypothetical protein
MINVRLLLSFRLFLFQDLDSCILRCILLALLPKITLIQEGPHGSAIHKIYLIADLFKLVIQ